MDVNIIRGKSVLTNTLDAFVGTLSVLDGTYYDGGLYLCKFPITNTTSAPTLNINGIGVKNIYNLNGVVPSIGDILINSWQILMYELSTDRFILLNGRNGIGTTRVFANDAARAAAVPDFISQIGEQTDSRTTYHAYGTSAGNWYLPANTQVQSDTYAVATGTNTYAITLTPALIAYAAGNYFKVKFTNANTGAATLNVNTIGAVAIKKNGAVALASGDIIAGKIYTVTHDGTNFQLGSQTNANDLFEVGSGAESLQTKGNSANASGDEAISIGKNSVASGIHGVAIGTGATAAGNAIGIGLNGVASGTQAIAIGDATTASNNDSVAIGTSITNSGLQAVSIGYSSSATAAEATALGPEADALAANSNAIGFHAKTNITKTTNLTGPLITKKSTAVSVDFFSEGAASVVTIMTDEIDLKATSDNTITIPSGAKFYVDGVDLIITTLGGTFTVQPTIKAGITGTLDKLLSAVTTAGLAALYDRECFTVASRSGESTLTASITGAASGSSTVKGRFVFKGILVENQA